MARWYFKDSLFRVEEVQGSLDASGCGVLGHLEGIQLSVDGDKSDNQHKKRMDKQSFLIKLTV